MQPISKAVVDDLAPKGVLRVAINFGNPVLAQLHAQTGAPMGKGAGWEFLQSFIGEMKRSGFVAHALENSGQRDASVAP